MTTEDDFDEEADLNEGADEMSEEEVMASKKRVGKKKKELKVKWKSQNKTNTKQLGGRLHRYALRCFHIVVLDSTLLAKLILLVGMVITM